MRWTTAAALALGMLAAAGESPAQDSTIDFIVAGPADWNTPTNWFAPGFGNAVPGDDFPQEIVSISNAGIAELTAPALLDVLGVVIGETHNPNRTGGPNATEEDGTLNISGAGQLRLVDPDGMGAAALRVGDAGRGVLNISNGSANADSLAVGGAANSTLFLNGSGTLGVSGNANVERITRIEGPNVTFDVEGDLRMRGTFVPVITGATHSAIAVSTGNANVGGTLQVQFSGHTPVLGNSWTLIDAASLSGTFSNIDISQAAGLPRGATFNVSYDAGGSGDVELSLDNRLILTVNRSTGAASIENAVGDSIEIHGYSIGSPSGLLDSNDNAWQSFADSAVNGWFEANPTANFLSELNPIGSTAIGAGVSLGVGNPYSFAPTELGQSGDDVTFEYSTVDGRIFSGIVEYSGAHNNLVLSVDPMTGEASLTNESAFSAEIIGYTVASLSGSLLPDNANWNSLEDQSIAGWREANPTTSFLSELNPTGSNIFDTGTSFNLGNLFDPAGSQDLTLEFALNSGEILDGIVVYEMTQQCNLVGDTAPCDDIVNIDDLNGVRNNFGAGDGSDTTGIPGDTVPFDGFVNIDDLNGVRNNFGAMAGPSPVPEPGTWVMLILGGVVHGLCRARRSRS